MLARISRNAHQRKNSEIRIHSTIGAPPTHLVRATTAPPMSESTSRIGTVTIDPSETLSLPMLKCCELDSGLSLIVQYGAASNGPCPWPRTGVDPSKFSTNGCPEALSRQPEPD